MNAATPEPAPARSAAPPPPAGTPATKADLDTAVADLEADVLKVAIGVAERLVLRGGTGLEG